MPVPASQQWFDRVYTETLPVVRRCAYAFLKSYPDLSAEADDLIQETYIRMFQAQEQLHSRGSVGRRGGDHDLRARRMLSYGAVLTHLQGNLRLFHSEPQGRFHAEMAFQGFLRGKFTAAEIHGAAAAATAADYERAQRGFPSGLADSGKREAHSGGHGKSFTHPTGASELWQSSAIAGCGCRAGTAAGAGRAGDHCAAILSRPDAIPDAAVSIWQVEGRFGNGVVHWRRILHRRNLSDPTNGIPERPPVGAPDRRMAARTDVKEPNGANLLFHCTFFFRKEYFS